MSRRLVGHYRSALGLGLSSVVLVVLLSAPSAAGAATRSPVVAGCATGAGNSTVLGSAGVAWDPVDHRVYVANTGTRTISVIKGTCTLSGTIHLPKGANPYAATFDPQNGRVYVTDFGLNQIYEISGNRIIGTISGKLSGPIAILYDPDASELLVADLWTDRVTVVAGTNANTTIPTGLDPNGLALDPHFGTVLVTNAYSDNVTLLNATNPTLPPVYRPGITGTWPCAVVFDPANDFDYIANYYSDNLTVLYGNGTKVGTIDVAAGPSALSYSVSRAQVYVSNHGGNSVWAVRGLSVSHKFKLGAHSGPLGLAYDGADHDVYVSGEGLGEVYVLK